MTIDIIESLKLFFVTVWEALTQNQLASFLEFVVTTYPALVIALAVYVVITVWDRSTQEV